MPAKKYLPAHWSFIRFDIYCDLFHLSSLNLHLQRILKNFPKAGFTLVEIMIVVAIIGLLAAIAIPNLVRSRATTQANACIGTLRQIDSAANLFALEHKRITGSPIINFPADLTPYIKLDSNGSIPACPAGGHYACPTVGVLPTCDLGSTVTPAHVLP